MTRVFRGPGIWALAGLAAGTILAAAHAWAQSLPSTAVTPLTILDRLFDLALAGGLLTLGGALGRRIVRWLRLDNASGLEIAVFSCAIGWGALAYVMLSLGILGLLYDWAALAVGAALAWWLRRDLRGLANGVQGLWSNWRALPVRLCPSATLRTVAHGEAWPAALPTRVLAVLCALILLLALLQALAPPTAYDALMYHLVMPQRWAAEHRLVIAPDIEQGNYPATAEMLFTVGLLFGSDRLAQLVHLAYGALGALGVLALGRRYFGREAGWIGAATYLSVPTVYFLLGTAYIDLAWAAYEFLLIYAFLVWGYSRGQRGWLLTAGLCGGWALGSKYLALYTVGLLALAFFYVSLRVRRDALRDIAIHGLLFGGSMTLVACPWYIRSWLWLGNPVYPYFWGGLGWDVARVQRRAYRGSLYGGLRSWLDYLTLPLDLYLHSERFSQVIFGFPSFLFWLIPAGLGALGRQPTVRFILILALARFAWWAVLAPTHVLEIRYYLPYYLLLAALTGAAAVYLAAALRRWLRRDLVSLLVVGYVLVMFYLQVYVFLGLNPLPVVLGWESSRDYLRRAVVNGAALDYVNEGLPASATVVFLGEAQTYYCRPACIPDSADDLLSLLVYTQRTPEGILAWLRARGVTHVLARQAHLIWDPRSDVGWLPAADFAVFEAFRDHYLVSVYSDHASEIFAVRYPP